MSTATAVIHAIDDDHSPPREIARELVTDLAALALRCVEHGWEADVIGDNGRAIAHVRCDGTITPVSR